MASWQERVIEEKRNLDKNIEALRAFVFDGRKMGQLHPLDKGHLLDQLNAMSLYSNALGRRINRFNKEA